MADVRDLNDLEIRVMAHYSQGTGIAQIAQMVGMDREEVLDLASTIAGLDRKKAGEVVRRESRKRKHLAAKKASEREQDAVALVEAFQLPPEDEVLVHDLAPDVGVAVVEHGPVKPPFGTPEREEHEVAVLVDERGEAEKTFDVEQAMAEGAVTRADEDAEEAEEEPPWVSVKVERKKAATTSTPRSPVEEVLQRAEQAGRKCALKAERIRTMVHDLERELDAIAEVLETERRITRLRAELVAQQQRLRDLKTGESSPRVAGQRTPTGGPAAAAVRAWAADNAMECPAMGRIPNVVLEAYEAAKAAA